MEEKFSASIWRRHTKQRISLLEKSEREEERELARLIEPMAQQVIAYLADISAISFVKETEPDIQREKVIAVLADTASALISNVELAFIEKEELQRARAIYRSIIYAERETLSEMIARLSEDPNEAGANTDLCLQGAFTAMRTFAACAATLPKDPELLWGIYSSETEWTLFDDWRNAENLTADFFTPFISEEAETAKEGPTPAPLEIQTPLKELFLQTTKVSSVLFSPDKWEAGGINAEITVLPGTKKNAPTVSLLQVHSEDLDSVFPANMAVARAVYDAACTEYAKGNKVFTPRMIARAISGKTDKENPSAETCAAVRDSLLWMMGKIVSYDCTEEYKKRGKIPKNFTGRIKKTGPLIHAELTVLQSGGNILEAFEMIAPPPLYSYANEIKQIADVRAELLDIKRVGKNGKATTVAISATSASIALRHEILRRILAMKNPNNNIKSKKIRLFSNAKPGLYSVAGYPAPSKAEAARLRKEAEAILDYYKAVGVIKGYTKTKTGRTFDGYEIAL